MNYDLYRELKELADREVRELEGEFESVAFCEGVEYGMTMMARRVLNAYAKDNGKRPAPYPEME